MFRRKRWQSDHRLSTDGAFLLWIAGACVTTSGVSESGALGDGSSGSGIAEEARKESVGFVSQFSTE